MEKAKQKAWQAYDSNNPTKSPYMEVDYCNGFEDGWRAHEKQSKDNFYREACIAAMNAFIQARPASSAKYITQQATAYARALTNEVYGHA